MINIFSPLFYSSLASIYELAAQNTVNARGKLSVNHNSQK